MTTLREAAQRVFDFAKWINDEQAIVPSHLMIALRTALSEPEQKTVPLAEYERLQRLVASQGIRLMEYESEPVQEPVAICRTWHEGRVQHAELWEWTDGLDALPDGEHRLYTRPAPQPVELTDEEIRQLGIATQGQKGGWDVVFARAVIEAYQRKQEAT